MALLNQTNCLTYQQLVTLGVDPESDVRNCGLLNAASNYFDGGLHSLNTVGTYYFMSTRNNKPAFRTHKGQVNVY